MSEDEDEELAILRFQALMSKRRGGSGAKKDLPFSLSVPVVSTAPALNETPVTTPAVVVTSKPTAETDPSLDVINNAGKYRLPHPVHGQVSYYSHIFIYIYFPLIFCCFIVLIVFIAHMITTYIIGFKN